MSTTSSTLNPFLEPFRDAAASAARQRPEVDAELAHDLMVEAATMLHNGLALEGLDDHDAQGVVTRLALALVEADPAAAVRRLAQAALDAPGGWHEPEVASGSFLVAASILQL